MSEEIKLLKGIIRIQTMLRGWMARRKYHNVQVKLYYYIDGSIFIQRPYVSRWGGI